MVCTSRLAGGAVQLQFGAGLGANGAVLALLLASAAGEAVGTATGTVGEEQAAVSGCGDGDGGGGGGWHGAQQVIGCEMFPYMANIAASVVSANQMDDVIQIIAAKSSEIDSESFQADLLVSELLDTALLGEGCIPSHADAIG